MNTCQTYLDLDTLNIPIVEIVKHFDFFLPLADMGKAQHQIENPMLLLLHNAPMEIVHL